MSLLDIPFIDATVPTDGHTPETCNKVIGLQAHVEALKVQLENALAKISCIEAKLDANNKATDELLEIIQMGRGFFKALGWIGKWIRSIILFIAPVVTAVVSMWYAITNKPQ